MEDVSDSKGGDAKVLLGVPYGSGGGENHDYDSDDDHGKSRKNNSNNKEEKNGLIQQQEQQRRYLRIGVGIILMVLSIVVGIVTHSYIVKNQNNNNKDPIAFCSILSVVIFVVTVLVVCVYDFCLTRQQQMLVNHAMASGAIVSSLFPEKVREQLYNDNNNNKNNNNNNNNNNKNNGMIATTKSTSTGSNKNNNNSSHHRTTAIGRPIASLYEDTTIFFADLAGFTAWSAVRSPAEVFELLETLYGAFDKIAVRHNVFKVETIGDCYVAVTGIPDPQPNDHALLMVKFAHECMTKMDQLIANTLSEKLGEDTKDLKMRVGLHTGPTTGGVLRGDKGRFQLFGDTVNTASRMESNGTKGKIHCSQATADALQQQLQLQQQQNGTNDTTATSATTNNQWLITPRTEKIVAKGKGQMQTYYITFNAPTKSDP